MLKDIVTYKFRFSIISLHCLISVEITFLQVKANIINETNKVVLNSKELLTKVSNLLALATKKGEELSHNSQVCMLLTIAIDCNNTWAKCA